ncbi:FadR family transcriptional regulator [Gordonia sp. zg691]|uniref:FadR family transcriptional regulator n=1 Tax=Gordonia jinghuaiqii TaxID=2758710 RepID=A0A7D7QMA0_9ACTN|nr:FCD domain-containing protein [Gordonia jinghuaiqii]MBD0862496.1 FadR family transcriptional regulator [Gordonia jinghuaiqii]MCR5976597.1 GntR family transcriptional regulator [Gordonia jinghuaiqii]QMS99785.1 FadR family transcriptional regulator [Gordonia jinghuaiqii]
MTKPVNLAPMMVPTTSGAIRSPKTAELVARTLRRMIVDGQLTEGDFLPHEADLMTHFQVSRPTLREAVRVLESERLVEVRRGSRTGARIRIPGPEIVARPAGLLLELSGTKLAEVMQARMVIEPAAAEMLAATANTEAFDELQSIIDVDLKEAYENGTLAQASVYFHRRMIELSGNSAMAMIAGMLNEIAERHIATTIHDGPMSRPQYNKLIRSYQKLVDLVRSGDGAAASAHWQRHMENSNKALLAGHEATRVRDVME